jgi:hypothetical protein
MGRRVAADAMNMTQVNMAKFKDVTRGFRR